jgi:DNA repair protein RAD7
MPSTRSIKSLANSEQKAIAKIKAGKNFRKRRALQHSDNEDEDEDEIARAIFKESMAPLPGQMENCAICDKRFTVTGYSRAGPDGGLLCPKCSKELDKEDGAAKKKQKTAAGRQRRQIQSNLLDGIYPGAKSLVTHCVEVLAKHVDQVEDFGDLPDAMVDKLAAILSKKRLIDPSTFNLFVRADRDAVTVYDGAKLSSDDYIKIFQIMPKIKSLRLRNAVQFKNKVIDHLLATTVELESLSLHGANLIDDERWDRFLKEKGMHLKALKVYHTDGHFGDEQVESLHDTCPNLTRLKICHNQKLTDRCLYGIARLKHLEHLSLEITNKTPTTSQAYSTMINEIGYGLRTLSLANIPLVDDTLLQSIHDHCGYLSKLRLTDNHTMTDAGFAALFTSWPNKELTYIDLHKCRHLESTSPRDNPQGIGFASLAFEAMMAHSGKGLRYLNINSCRHIEREAFERVFMAGKVYGEVREVNVSFCSNVDDFVVGLIWKACPGLKTLKVFGCFGVKDVKVPKGRILIGVPNALGMQIEGVEEEGMVI